MKSTFSTCIFSTAFTAIFCAGIADYAEAGNSWRWAKPLNQKPGSLFYTTNRKARGTTSSRRPISRRSFRSRSYTQPKPITHAYDPHIALRPSTVIVYSTPTSQIPTQPVPASRPAVSPAPAVRPPREAPSALDEWLAK